MSKIQRIMELRAAVQADASEGKAETKAEQAEMQQLARELAAELKLPVYPIGLEANFGTRWVKILNAWKNGDDWIYQVDARLGMIFGLGDGVHTLTESEIRAKLASELGAMGQGQAYPRGIMIRRNGKGGVVESATQDPKTGEWVYQLRGQPNAVAQSELTAILRVA